MYHNYMEQFDFLSTGKKGPSNASNKYDFSLKTILQKENHVGESGGQKRGDEAPIHLMKKFRDFEVGDISK